MTSSPTVPRGSVLRWAVVFEGGVLVLAWVLGRLLTTPPFAQFHLTWQAMAWGVVATVPLIIVALRWAVRSPWEFFARVRRTVDELVVTLFADCSYPQLALIAVMASVAEEALFRGVIQTAVAGALDPWVGLAVASLVFGLAHLVTPAYAFLAGLIGLYLGSLFIAFENLAVPVAVHMFYDFVGLVYLVRRHRAQEPAAPAAVEPEEVEAMDRGD